MKRNPLKICILLALFILVSAVFILVALRFGASVPKSQERGIVLILPRRGCIVHPGQEILLEAKVIGDIPSARAVFGIGKAPYMRVVTVHGPPYRARLEIPHGAPSGKLIVDVVADVKEGGEIKAVYADESYVIVER